jgi:hypothetical protein
MGQNSPPNLANAIRELAEVLESLGYSFKEGHGVEEEQTVFSPYTAFAVHNASVPVIVNVFNGSVEVACYRSFWQAARNVSLSHAARDKNFVQTSGTESVIP